jgi:hypothetical protein
VAALITVVIREKRDHVLVCVRVSRGFVSFLLVDNRAESREAKRDEEMHSLGEGTAGRSVGIYTFKMWIKNATSVICGGKIKKHRRRCLSVTGYTRSRQTARRRGSCREDAEPDVEIRSGAHLLRQRGHWSRGREEIVQSARIKEFELRDLRDVGN